MLLTHLFENRINISEGGNIFKGDLATQRINQADVAPTVAWLEKHTGLPLQDGMLGTTGRKDTSGDLDLAVDSRSISKDQLVAKLSAVAKAMNLNPADVIKKSGISVHFRTPIAGDPKKGHVQADFMFTDDPEWTKFSMAASGTSQYKGAHKHIVMSSIAKAMGLKWSATAGLLTRDSGKLLSKNPDEIAEMLLGKGRDRKDLESVETLLDALKDDPERDEKLLDARETLARENVKLPESINEAVPGYDRDHYGNWTVDMSQKPVKMPKLTGDTVMYVAKATHKKIEGLVLYGKGNTQGAARDDAMSQIHDKTRSADPDAFKQFTIDLNVDFTREYLDPKSGNYFKMAKNDAGEPVLVMASRDYFAAFGKDMEQLGFRRGYQRTSAARMGAAATPVYAVPTSKGQVKALGLIPNMRYSLHDVGQDEDGNQMFALKADTRVISPQDRYKMGVPGLTLAATMAEDAPADQVHGTDKAKTVKPRPFAGSQPHPFQGKLVGGESKANEEDNPTDRITLDIPLFLRMMEYAREDAKTDMDLHHVTERAIELMKSHDYLCMDNYEEIVGGVEESNAFTDARMKAIKAGKDSFTVGDRTYPVTGDTKDEEGAVVEAKKKPKPTNPELWSRAKAAARSKFEVYPSAYANAWAAKWYKSKGGGWRMGK